MTAHDSRAWRLLEALHTPFSNEERLGIIHQALDAERADAWARGFEDARRSLKTEPRNATEGL